MSRFDLHWCDVPPDQAPGLASSGCTLIALWPAPVNHDECFAEAGFEDFGDNDNEWDRKAHELLVRIVEALSMYGEPKVVKHEPGKQQSWWSRFLHTPQDHSLIQELELPSHWDSLPRCLVAFGERGTSLRTGNGHVLFWITLPSSDAGELQAFLVKVAAACPLFRTPLRWRTLLVAA